MKLVEIKRTDIKIDDIIVVKFGNLRFNDIRLLYVTDITEKEVVCRYDLNHKLDIFLLKEDINDVSVYRIENIDEKRVDD